MMLAGYAVQFICPSFCERVKLLWQRLRQVHFLGNGHTILVASLNLASISRSPTPPLVPWIPVGSLKPYWQWMLPMANRMELLMSPRC